MTEQPTALRLADAIDPLTRRNLDNLTCAAAAAELRRLAKVEDEWAALSQDQGKLEGQIDRLVAQRDALLTVLKELTGHINERFSGGVWGRARAAIKAVEEGK